MNYKTFLFVLSISLITKNVDSKPHLMWDGNSFSIGIPLYGLGTDTRIENNGRYHSNSDSSATIRNRAELSPQSNVNNQGIYTITLKRESVAPENHVSSSSSHSGASFGESHFSSSSSSVSEKGEEKSHVQGKVEYGLRYPTVTIESHGSYLPLKSTSTGTLQTGMVNTAELNNDEVHSTSVNNDQISSRVDTNENSGFVSSSTAGSNYNNGFSASTTLNSDRSNDNQFSISSTSNNNVRSFDAHSSMDNANTHQDTSGTGIIGIQSNFGTYPSYSTKSDSSNTDAQMNSGIVTCDNQNQGSQIGSNGNVGTSYESGYNQDCANDAQFDVSASSQGVDTSSNTVGSINTRFDENTDNNHRTYNQGDTNSGVYVDYTGSQSDSQSNDFTSKNYVRSVEAQTNLNSATVSNEETKSNGYLGGSFSASSSQSSSPSYQNNGIYTSYPSVSFESRSQNDGGALSSSNSQQNTGGHVSFASSNSNKAQSSGSTFNENSSQSSSPSYQNSGIYSSYPSVSFESRSQNDGGTLSSSNSQQSTGAHVSFSSSNSNKAQSSGSTFNENSNSFYISSSAKESENNHAKQNMTYTFNPLMQPHVRVETDRNDQEKVNIQSHESGHYGTAGLFPLSITIHTHGQYPTPSQTVSTSLNSGIDTRSSVTSTDLNQNKFNVQLNGNQEKKIDDTSFGVSVSSFDNLKPKHRVATSNDASIQSNWLFPVSIETQKRHIPAGSASVNTGPGNGIIITTDNAYHHRHHPSTNEVSFAVQPIPTTGYVGIGTSGSGQTNTDAVVHHHHHHKTTGKGTPALVIPLPIFTPFLGTGTSVSSDVGIDTRSNQKATASADVTGLGLLARTLSSGFSFGIN